MMFISGRNSLKIQIQGSDKKVKCWLTAKWPDPLTGKFGHTHIKGFIHLGPYFWFVYTKVTANRAFVILFWFILILSQKIKIPFDS